MVGSGVDGVGWWGGIRGGGVGSKGWLGGGLGVVGFGVMEWGFSVPFDGPVAKTLVASFFILKIRLNRILAPPSRFSSLPTRVNHESAPGI